MKIYLIYPSIPPDYPALFDLMSTRRSIRHFKDEPVPRELLEKIIDAAAQAPMGFPPHKTHITVIQDRSTIVRMLPIITKFYEDMVGWMKNPIFRFTIKCQTTPEDFATIKNHLIPLLLKRLPEIRKAGSDEITWGAPALMLFHAERVAESHTVDALYRSDLCFPGRPCARPGGYGERPDTSCGNSVSRAAGYAEHS